MDEFEAEFSLAEELMMVLRGAYEDRMIASAELGLLDAIPDDPFPMPNTCHPHYQWVAEWVRNNGNPAHNRYVNVVKPASVRNLLVEPDEIMPTITTYKTILCSKKCAAPMPFVGDPRYEQAIYFWYTWLDDIGRHISTDSTVVWRDHY